MKYVLVSFSDNWADEFDISGFRIMPKKEWDDYVTNVKAIKFWPQGMYFGTNEGIEYDNSKDYLNSFDAKSITAAEKATIEKFLGKSIYGYGHFLEFTEKWEYITRPSPLW